MTDVPDLVATTDELYAGSPAEYVAHRDELARQARVSGDRPLAAAIKALRRPTVGAWYVNVASRAGLTSLREWLRLGRLLRQAQEAGDFVALRELALQRGPLEARVLRDLAAHLLQLGVTATPAGLDEARATLSAALADPAVDALVAAGRVDRPYVYAGFGGMDISVPPAAGEAADSGEGPPEHSQTVVDAARLAAVAGATRELAAAEVELVGLIARRKAAEASAVAASARFASLTAELLQAQAEVSAAEELKAELQLEEKAIQVRIEHARGLLNL